MVETTRRPRPATFSCLFLGVGSFDEPVDIDVTTIRDAKRSEALRVCVTQRDRPLLEAHVWAIVEPEVRQWMRFAPVARFEDDPWVDACRSVVLLDTFQWPAAHRTHVNRGPDEAAFIAPNIDLSVRFHRAKPDSEWLLIDARGPVAEGGLMAGDARLWSEDGRLVASAASHLLCREVPRGTPGSGTAP